MGKKIAKDSSSDKLGRLNMWLQKGILKRETESLQIATENKGIKNNYIKAKNW